MGWSREGGRSSLTFAVDEDAGVAAVGAEEDGFRVGELFGVGGGGAGGWVGDAFEELCGGIVSTLESHDEAPSLSHVPPRQNCTSIASQPNAGKPVGPPREKSNAKPNKKLKGNRKKKKKHLQCS